MKRYTFVFILMLSFACWRCADFIDVRPENSPTYTNYFKTLDDAEALLTGLQVRMKAIYKRGKIAVRGEYADVDPSNHFMKDMNVLYAKQDWGDFYDVIYQADLILDNAHRFQVSEEEIKPYVLQAYFAKAVAYFGLARNFGEVPITKGSTVFDAIPQSSLSEVLDKVEEYGTKALDLPPYEEMANTAYGDRCKQYGCKGAAAALMAHLCAWRAGVEGKSEYWAKAEEYCRMIIDGECGSYTLAETPEEVCTNVMVRNSSESIWEIYIDAINVSLDGRTDIAYVGFPVLTDSYYLPDRMDKPVILKTTVDKMYPEGDLRKDSYFWGVEADSLYLKYVDGEVVPGLERGKDSVINAWDNDEIERALMYKFRYPYYTMTASSGTLLYKGLNQNVIVWRLADIYLLRAECRARQGKSDAAEDLNKVRSRAYGDLDRNALTEKYAFPCADDVKNGLAGNIQLAIFREREKELVGEYHRYWDIVRNGWCFLRGEDSYDYIRKEISEAYAHLTDQDIQDGALYFMISDLCFDSNNMIRQNVYWNRQIQ